MAVWLSGCDVCGVVWCGVVVVSWRVVVHNLVHGEKTPKLFQTDRFSQGKFAISRQEIAHKKFTLPVFSSKNKNTQTGFAPKNF